MVTRKLFVNVDKIRINIFPDDWKPDGYNLVDNGRNLFYIDGRQDILLQNSHWQK